MLDSDALAAALAADPDAGVKLLVDLARATDRELRAAARRLAPQLLVPLARSGGGGPGSGAVRLVTSRTEGVDLDADATLEAVVATPHPGAEDLRWRRWVRPGRAYVLVVDASGSVTGRPLATAVVVAAALAGRLRPVDELAVVAFWSSAVVLRPIDAAAGPATVLDALFDLRGGDTTDIAGALRAALDQAAGARAARREIVVLSDGMVTAGTDPADVAADAGTVGAVVHVLALSDAPDALGACTRLADAGGGRCAPLLRVGDAPEALGRVLGGG